MARIEVNPLEWESDDLDGDAVRCDSVNFTTFLIEKVNGGFVVCEDWVLWEFCRGSFEEPFETLADAQKAVQEVHEERVIDVANRWMTVSDGEPDPTPCQLVIEKMKGLSANHLRFLQNVHRYAGCKMNDGRTYSIGGVGVWEELESRDLIKCVGSYQWIPVDPKALSLALDELMSEALQ